MDAELEFAILHSTTGKQLFDQVRFTLQLKKGAFVRKKCHHKYVLSLPTDSEDYRPEGNVGLWPPVSGQ